MNKPQLQSFVELARAIPPDERVPYAFEKRILARLKTAALDPWAAWSSLMWRAAVACVMVSLCAGVLATVKNSSSDLVASDLEEVLFAPLHATAEGDLW